MSRENLLQRLHELEHCEQPGSAAAQLRELKNEIRILLGKGYTLKQVWTSLAVGGLDVTFSGFKAAVYRMRVDAEGLQKVSQGVNVCPHCGQPIDVPAVDGPRDDQPHGQDLPLENESGDRVPASVSDGASEQAASDGSANTPFADVFLECKDFTVGRRWK
ncbi:hypothetical protein NDK50_15175 [Paraburkholderia bryophila]|uniref:hypothetical protein n=1 Tax=Paraburkholderia bryophila TaxID=420952 RepID=UPI00234A48F6|nr:hypothetical protein [Paraburkholderia bryophila]WCM18771.1 hypothetical protein NDK50_15175 [Paraburkholderia bryophila]